ncbi:MAG: hypothetical protein ACE37F_37045 [Nannocystaceae bacterium]|nr:hypothetical protein [bacterium]
MQDRNAGDVGDFGKLGLLRHLVRGPAPLRLGVLWYRVPDESGNNDGGHIYYLAAEAKQHAHLWACDPPLAQALGALIASGTRSIAALERAAGLPADNCFHDVPLDLAGVPVVDRSPTCAARFASAVRAVEGADLVFLDPDDGQEAKNATLGQAKIVQDARYDDLKALTSRKGSARTFFIMPSRAHEQAIDERMNALPQAIFDRARDPSELLPPTRAATGGA